MNWGTIWVEVLIASLVTGFFGVIAVLITNVFVDKRGYDKIDRKIGNIDNETLAKQHENIRKDISHNTQSFKELQSKEFYRIYSKVDNIDKIMNRNEARYENLNLDQKEVRNNVNKLVNSWEALIKENQELKELVLKLEYENQKLKQKTKVKNQREDEWDREL